MIATAQRGDMAWAARKTPSRRLTAQQARALLRLREIETLSAWRARFGVDILSAENFVHVIIDALAHASDVSRRCVCLSDIRALLPRGPVALDMREAQILFLISNVSLGERLMSATEAGRAVELVEVERAEIESEGLVIQTLYPRDETAFARSQRRAKRRRELARKRVALHRIKMQENRASNRVTPAAATLRENVATPCNAALKNTGALRDGVQAATLRASQADIIAAAIAAGAETIAAIAATSGLHHRIVRPILSRLIAAQRITRVARGRYLARPP